VSGRDVPQAPTQPVEVEDRARDAGAAPAPSPQDGPARRPSWRRRHPKTARGVLYGTFAAVLAAGLAWGTHAREEARQAALLTRLHGIEVVVRPVNPENALEQIRSEVLAKDPDEDVRRRALLAEAAALDALERYDEAEAAYRRIEAEWPAGRPRGALMLPWANMLVRAGRPAEALERLDAPGATEGESADDVRGVRDAARVPAGLRRRR
jgi:hypothetical protein